LEPNIYGWLKDHQSITSPSGVTYDVPRFQETIALIDSLQAEIERLRDEIDQLKKERLIHVDS
jgi:hypothetical protein